MRLVTPLAVADMPLFVAISAGGGAASSTGETPLYLINPSFHLDGFLAIGMGAESREEVGEFNPLALRDEPFDALLISLANASEACANVSKVS